MIKTKNKKVDYTKSATKTKSETNVGQSNKFVNFFKLIFRALSRIIIVLIVFVGLSIGNEFYSRKRLNEWFKNHSYHITSKDVSKACHNNRYVREVRDHFICNDENEGPAFCIGIEISNNDFPKDKNGSILLEPIHINYEYSELREKVITHSFNKFVNPKEDSYIELKVPFHGKIIPEYANICITKVWTDTEYKKYMQELEAEDE